MKTDNKKAKTYRVFCDLDRANVVKGFAEKHMVKGTVTEVKVLGNKLAKHSRVTIVFKSNETETTIYKAFMDEFKNCQVKIIGRNLSI